MRKQNSLWMVLVLGLLICIIVLLPFATCDWTMYRADPVHSGEGSGNPALTPTLVWKYEAGSIIASSPAVVNGVVYVGAGQSFNARYTNGTVYAFDGVNGSKLWSYVTDSGEPIIATKGIGSSPAVINGVVYVGSEDGKLYALNATNGSRIWSYQTGEIESPPNVANCIVYVGSIGGEVFALNASLGTLLWDYSTGLGLNGDYGVVSSPAIADGVIYVSSVNGNLYAFDAATGSCLWNRTLGGNLFSSPTVVNGIVYLGSLDHNVYALNASNGAQLWNYLTSYEVGSSPSVVNGVVYIGSGQGAIIKTASGLNATSYGAVYALNAVSGDKIWSCTLGGEVESSPALEGGVVYVGSYDGNIYALNSTNGNQIWSYPTGKMVESSPAVVDGVVYIGSDDGTLYALGSPTLSTANVAVTPDNDKADALFNATSAQIWVAIGIAILIILLVAIILIMKSKKSNLL